MGVNCPSVEALDLTIAGEFVPHATSSENKRQERGVEGGSRDRDRKGRNRKDSGKIYRVIDKQRRRVNFVLNF